MRAIRALVALVALGASLALPGVASASSTYYAADGTLCTNAATAATLARVAPQMRVEILNVGPHCGGPVQQTGFTPMFTSYYTVDGTLCTSAAAKARVLSIYPNFRVQEFGSPPCA